ncbi:hypothetical protein ACKKBG_A19430 [Auxenochlorella protothecoides x Auxenochlorella symbiontica]
MGSQQLITAVCTVIFDLDQGQKIESLHPPASLSEGDQQRVAYHAFPDSTAQKQLAPASIRDSSFFFRLPRRGSSLYGFVFCRQRQDEALRRGAEQRSFVVLSPLPLHALWTALACAAGPVCLAYGPHAVVDVYEAALVFPIALPLADREAQVWIRGQQLTLALPDPATIPGTAATQTLDPGTGLPQALLADSHKLTAGPYSHVDVYSALQPVLQHLWTLWELLVLGRRLAVIGASPGVCSEGIAALLSLLSPLPYAGDVRPYLTIQDPGFAALTCQGSGAAPGAPQTGAEGDGASGAQPEGAPTLVGVTNLYFLKGLPAWPNTVALGWGGGEASGAQTAAAAPWAPRRLARAAAGRLASLVSRPSAAGALLGAPAPSDGAWLAPGSGARAQRGVLGALVEVPAPSLALGPERGRRLAAANSAVLRRHFQELTRALLFPLLPCITPAPRPGQGSPGPGDRGPPDFDPGRVLADLADPSGTIPDPLVQVFGTRARVVAFYARFLASRNCRAWVEQRQADARAWQLRRMLGGDIAARGGDELEPRQRRMSEKTWRDLTPPWAP